MLKQLICLQQITTKEIFTNEVVLAVSKYYLWFPTRQHKGMRHIKNIFMDGLSQLQIDFFLFSQTDGSP
jgi:hypothetical protein